MWRKHPLRRRSASVRRLFIRDHPFVVPDRPGDREVVVSFGLGHREPEKATPVGAIISGASGLIDWTPRSGVSF